MPSSAFDVAIVGAGPAGSIAALTAAQAGLRTALVDEAVRSPRVRVGEVLPPPARWLLHRVGALRNLASGDCLVSCGTRSAWGSPSLAATDFLSSPLGPGLHLDRLAFDRALVATASAEGVTVLGPARVTRVSRERTRWRLWIGHGSAPRPITAHGLVDCTGRRAAIARRLGATRRADDALVAIVTWLDSKAGTDRDTTLTVEAGPGGWWYTARLPGDTRVVGYVTDRTAPELDVARTALGWRAFVNRTEHVREICDGHRYELRSGPTVVSAASARLDVVAGRDWAAAGDAAASFDPVSAQGILTAMLSGRLAARAIASRVGGDGGRGLEEYSMGLHAVYDEYLRARIRYYRLEARWPDSPFWRARWFRTNGDGGRPNAA